MAKRGKSAKTVAVIGAGIVGVSTALWLQRDGHKVILIDKAGPGEGASSGNGGILASCSVVPVTVPGLFFKAPGMLFSADGPLFLRWSYLPKLAPWLIRYLRGCRPQETRRIAAAIAGLVGNSLEEHQALAAGTPAERWLKPSDYLYLYRNRAAFKADAFGWNLRKEHGVAWQELEGQAVRDFDPIFADDQTFAVRLSEHHGHITDPGAYVRALADQVVADGGRLIAAEVTDIVRSAKKGLVSGVIAGGEKIACNTAVVTLGAWSGGLMKKLGVKVPLESERGYHVEFLDPSAMPRAPVMVASGKFVATPMEGRLRLAGIVEFGGLDAPASKAPIELLKHQLRLNMPGLTWKSTREWLGHRPAPCDSIPLIGKLDGVPGAYAGFGHHHIGLTAGPRTGRILADVISGRRPNIDLAPYRPDRFS
jgi:D-amino-acid dehydrogenase